MTRAVTSTRSSVAKIAINGRLILNIFESSLLFSTVSSNVTAVKIIIQKNKLFSNDEEKKKKLVEFFL